MSTTDRLVALQKKQAKREHKKAVYDAGFDNHEDFARWAELEELRKLTLAERKATAPSVRLSPIDLNRVIGQGGTVTVNNLARI